MRVLDGAALGRRACEERVANPTPMSSNQLDPKSIMKLFKSKKAVGVSLVDR